MPNRPLRATAVLALAAAVTLAACSGGSSAETDKLRQDLEVQAEAQGALRARLDDAERAIDALRSGEDSEFTQVTDELRGRLDAVEQQLAETLVARLDSIDGELSALSNLVDEENGGLAAGLDELRGTVGGLADDVEQLRSDVAGLADAQELLRALFDNHIEQDH